MWKTPREVGRLCRNPEKLSNIGGKAWPELQQVLYHIYSKTATVDIWKGSIRQDFCRNFLTVKRQDVGTYHFNFLYSNMDKNTNYGTYRLGRLWRGRKKIVWKKRSCRAQFRDQESKGDQRCGGLAIMAIELRCRLKNYTEGDRGEKGMA